MKRLRGMFQDCHPSDQPEGTYRDMLNGLINNQKGALTNEPGTELTVTWGTGAESIIGKIHVGEDVVLFVKGTPDRIFLYNKETVSAILGSAGLNFSTSYPIQGTYKTNSKGERVIYWVDGLNPARFINIDNPVNSIDDLLLFPNVEAFPQVGVSSIDTFGGSLRTGSYYVAIAYVDAEGTATNYLTVSNPINIALYTELTPNKSVTGSIGDLPTSKSLRLQVSNIDTSYDSLRIALIPSFDGILSSVRIIPDVPITSESSSIIVTGEESFIEGSLEEILINRAVYLPAAIAQLDNTLYMGNLKRSPDIGYQKYANAIRAIGVTEEITSAFVAGDHVKEAVSDKNTSYKNPIVSFSKKGYKRGEVYAFYIAFLLKDGSMSRAYHIPGRQAETIVIESGTGTKAQGSLTINNKQIDNTTTSELLVVLTSIVDFPEFEETLYVTSYITSALGTRTTAEFAILAGENTEQVNAKLASAWQALVNCTGDATPAGIDNDPRSGVIISSNDPLLEGQTISFGFTATGLSADIDKLNALYTSVITHYLDPGTIVKRLNITLPETTQRQINITRGDTIADILTRIGFAYAGSVYTSTVTGSTITFNASLFGTEYNGGTVTVTDFDNSFTYSQTFTPLSGGTVSVADLVENELATETEFPWFGASAKKFHLRSYSGSNELGYWQNEGEPYKNTDDWDIWDTNSQGYGFYTGQSLRGQAVRHHRIVDNADNLYVTNPLEQGSIFTTGIKFENIPLPKEILEQTTGFRIFYAKRTNENKTILDSCFASYGYLDSDVGRDVFTTDDSKTETKSIVYALPYATLAESRSIGGLSHIKASIWAGSIGNPELIGGAPFNLFRDSRFNKYSGIVDGASVRTLAARVKAKAFIPANEGNVALLQLSFSKNLDNRKGVSFVAIETEQATTFLDSFYEGVGGYTGKPIIDLCSYKTSVYNPFDTQPLVWTGYQRNHPKSFDPDYNTYKRDTFSVFGGDIFISPIALKFYQRGVVGEEEMNPIWGGLLHYGVLETDLNADLRHSNAETKEIYYPLYSIDSVVRQDDFRDLDNTYLQNPDFSQINDIKPAFPYPSVGINIGDHFPTRIMRSIKSSLEERSDSFRIFLENDVADLPLNRGEIVKLGNLNNNLLVHMQRGLFVTRGREELKVGDIRAFIGSGDILAAPANEIVQDEIGYGGLQHPYASIQTPFGYFFVDNEGKKIFKLGESLEDLSNKGMRNYFDANISSSIVGFDPRFRRFMVSTSGNTFSYDFESGVWVSRHSFYPQFYLNFLGGMHTIIDGACYKHTNTTNPGLYYGTLYPFIIYSVENENPNVSKTADAVYFDTIMVDPTVKSAVPYYTGSQSIEETFTSIRVKNSYQDTGEVALVAAFNPGFNVRRTRKYWAFNQIRNILNSSGNPDINKLWYNKDLLQDTYHEVILTYTNQSAKLLYLIDQTMHVTPSLQ